jgi:hypothetical protein
MKALRAQLGNLDESNNDVSRKNPIQVDLDLD